ncbi:MAG: response regulator [Rhizobiaceae bacterium]|nr:response regulator [Rhizobiaceae bacterium]
MLNATPIRILVADDDADDRMLIGDAFEEACLKNPVDFVEDGLELLEYLKHEGKFADLAEDIRPGIILLDLNMPRMDGRTALQEIRNDPELRNIPIVVLTTSKSEEDILRTYDLGVNSFITKPVTFDGLVKVVQILNQYWVEIVALPANID